VRRADEIDGTIVSLNGDSRSDPCRGWEVVRCDGTVAMTVRDAILILGSTVAVPRWFSVRASWAI